MSGQEFRVKSTPTALLNRLLIPCSSRPAFLRTEIDVQIRARRVHRLHLTFGSNLDSGDDDLRRVGLEGDPWGGP